MDFHSLGENSVIHVVRKRPYKYLTGTLKSKGSQTTNNGNIYMPVQVTQNIDVVVNVDGNDEVLPNIPPNLETVEYKGSYYSVSLSGIQQAIMGLVQVGKTGIDDQSYFQSLVDEGEKTLEQINPQYAEGKRQSRTIEELVRHRDETDKQLKELATQTSEVLSILRELGGSPKK
jgi:hypothetical protein